MPIACTPDPCGDGGHCFCGHAVREWKPLLWIWDFVMSVDTAPATIETFADFVERLGGIPLERIRFRPVPGTATESDVLEVERRENRLCELVDGVLVEKPVGYRESLLAVAISTYLNQYVLPRNLGLVTGEGGMVRLFPGLVRIPDVAFVRWESIPGGQVPSEPIPDLAPDLAVEVLSRSNTPKEMRRKRSEYFDAGVQLVWIVDPEARSVSVFKAPSESQQLTAADTLTGHPVLSGFSLPLSELFSHLDRQQD